MIKENKPKLDYHYSFYLVDPVRCDYKEYSLLNLKKKLDRSETFIRKYAETRELFVIDGRGYYLTNDFGYVWDLL